MDNNRSFKNPLPLILNTTIWIFIVLLIFYVGVRISLTYDIQEKQTELLGAIADDLKAISIFVFKFVRPFLQLVIILLVLEWLLSWFGISLDKNFKFKERNTQTAIAMVVIIAFALAALRGVENAGMLKDVALVVVVFYFGTQKKTTETVKGEEKILETRAYKR